MKVVSCRFYKCFGPFNMLTVEGCSEKRPFRQLPNHVFCSLYFPKHMSYEVHLLFKCSKIDIYLRNAGKNSEKLFTSEIIAFALVAGISDYSEKNTCQRQSVYWQSALGLQIWLRGTFSQSALLIVIKKFDKRGAI